MLGISHYLIKKRFWHIKDLFLSYLWLAQMKEVFSDKRFTVLF